MCVIDLILFSLKQQRIQFQVIFNLHYCEFFFCFGRIFIYLFFLFLFCCLKQNQSKDHNDLRSTIDWLIESINIWQLPLSIRFWKVYFFLCNSFFLFRLLSDSFCKLFIAFQIINGQNGKKNHQLKKSLLAFNTILTDVWTFWF